MQGVTPAVQALHHTRVELRSGKGDAAAATGQQVPRHGRTGIGLTKAHTVQGVAVAGGQIHQVHAGHLAAGDQLARGRVVVQPGDQQTGRAVQQLLAQQLLFFAGVVVRHAHQGLVTGGAKTGLRGVEQVDKQGIGQQWNQDAYMVTALRGQRPGRRVGHVAEHVRHGRDALDQGRVHRPFAAQRPRHGAGADTGGAGHIAQGDAA